MQKSEPGPKTESNGKGESAGGGGHAWSVSTEAASQYLRARIPIPPYLIDYCFAYHELSGKSPAKWDAVLDLGCGPGQLAVHMSKRFKHVYGRDVSQQMIDIARTLPRMDDDELKEVGLFKPDPSRTFDYALGNAQELNMPDQSVDMIIMGSSAHWFDWSTNESSRRIWQEWTRVLRPNGTIIAQGSLPAPGSGTGEEGKKTKPLRHKIRNIAHSAELAKYYDKKMLDMGTGTMLSALIMPWQVGLEDDNRDKPIWNRSSKLFLMFDNQDPDIAVDGFPPPRSDPVPNWMPSKVARFITTPEGIGIAYEQTVKQWKTTTPRRMAAWLRSASGYVHHLRDNPEDKLRVGRDDDLAAQWVKEACQEGGLSYDETIELHNPNGVLAVRRM